MGARRITNAPGLGVARTNITGGDSRRHGHVCVGQRAARKDHEKVGEAARAGNARLREVAIVMPSGASRT